MTKLRSHGTIEFDTQTEEEHPEFTELVLRTLETSKYITTREEDGDVVIYEVL